jgi:hypothetical protein
MRISNTAIIALVGMAATTAVTASVWGGEHRHGMAMQGDQAAPAPIRITMEDLHAHGGVPPGWECVRGTQGLRGDGVLRLPRREGRRLSGADEDPTIART